MAELLAVACVVINIMQVVVEAEMAHKALGPVLRSFDSNCWACRARRASDCWALWGLALLLYFTSTSATPTRRLAENLPLRAHQRKFEFVVNPE